MKLKEDNSIKTKKMFVIIFMSLFFISFSSGLVFHNSEEEIDISSIDQKCIIQDKENLFCNVLIDVTYNESKENINLYIFDGNIGTALFDKKNIKFYEVGSRGNPSGDYLNFNFSKNPLEIDFKGESSEESINIEFNSSGFKWGRGYILFSYIVDDFVTKDQVYNTLFFNLHGVSEETRISRTIILPENSIIEVSSLYNSRIMAILEDGRRIISSNVEDNSIIVYRDWNKEQKDRNKRDRLILFISFSLTLIFGFLFSDKKTSKRTKNCWMLFGLSLLITSWILFVGEKGNFLLKIILIVSFIGIPFFGGLAYYSRKKDYKRLPKSDFRNIKKLILNLIKDIFNG
jgi:hypothetical protein